MTKSQQLFTQAKTLIPGGVNSPVRDFSSVGGNPIFFKKGKGAYLIDVDDKKYIDYVASWGAMILGHNHPVINSAVKKTLDNGIGFGAPTEIETKLASKICKLMPAIELLRMVNSGTEATMSAIRLARGYTKRDIIVKFEGCYHGHSDALLVKAGSGALTLGKPSSDGVPADLAKHTLTLPYNNISQIKHAFAKFGAKIACVIAEPVVGNMNCILPTVGFLQTLREVCDNSGAVLIFDEVMTGFRVGLGGATDVFNITPDLITLGKVIGGGFPVGAFGGKERIMNHIAPLGGVYQAGTLSGNPVSMSAGLAVLEYLAKNADIYDKLQTKTTKLTNGIVVAARKYNIAMTSSAIGGMFGLFFTDADKVENFAASTACNSKLFNKFFCAMLRSGIYLAPSPYEAGFVSNAHSDADINKTINIADKIFSYLSQS